MTNMKDKLHTGELYLPNDGEIMAEQLLCMEKLYDYNGTRPSETEKRAALLSDMFAEIGQGCYIEPPLHANWGGKNCHFGKNVYANFGLTLVDDTDIFVGDCTLIGPNVVIDTGTHPVCPELRERGYQYNLPVKIGKNCWIGAGSVILPGVTVGDNSVIGAGRVVTHDVPPNVIAVGSPARVLRSITDRDREYYRNNRKIPPDLP
ncbi:MAG: sugar O-acetyltransferase [Clostridia bacterium]|nr:sugar O-acetyltransferase [Clostridia bacterium]